MTAGQKHAAPKGESQKDKVLSTLKGSSNGMTKKELAYAMGMQEETLGRLLSPMQKQKMLRKRKNVYHVA